MDTQKQPLREVRIEDFNIALLRRAARQGRLFIAPETPADEFQESSKRQQLIDSILTYVQSIAPYSPYPCVGDIWDAVLHDQRLAPLFFLTRYSQSRGTVNWYRVTALMCLMRELGVYQTEIPASRLHCILEGTNRRTNYYTGMGKYLFEKAEIKAIREILNRFRQ